MKKKIKLNKIFGFGLIGTFIFLLIICISSHAATYKFSFKGCVNCILMVVACGILCLISALIFRLFPKTYSEKEQSNAILTNNTDKETLLKPYEQAILDKATERVSVKDRLKNIAIGFLIFAVCGAGYIPLSIFAANSIKKINSAEYVKVEAVVKKVEYDINENESELVYSYVVKDGTTYTSADGAAFGGAIFKEGKTVSIYYNVSEPQNIVTLSKTIMMILTAAFFFLIGLAVFINSCGRNDGTIILLAIGVTFILFTVGFITAIQAASGLAFFELLGCGAIVYTLLCFGVIGLSLIVYYVFYLIHKAKLLADYKKYIW